MFQASLNGTIRLLDLALHFAKKQVSSGYELRGKKRILAYWWAHAMLAKQGITSLCLKKALVKFYTQPIHRHFQSHVSRLTDAGYPIHVLSAAAGSMLLKFRNDNRNATVQVTKERKKIIALLYIEKIG